jgi:4-hydroxy-tetrahydrodipicolinate reductase
MTRVLVIGHGRMGQLVAQHAAAHGCEIAAVVDVGQRIEDISVPVDVAIDFSVADAVVPHLRALAASRTPVVIGVTGWAAQLEDARAIQREANLGVLAAANFSIGLHIFRAAVATAARGFAAQAYGAWIHEAHHIHKKDAPSGTALVLREAMTTAGYGRTIDVSSTRAGEIPGTHTVGFDGAADTVTLTHTVRDRAVFAHGALEAAKWLVGRRGWFSMDDFVGRQQ